MDTCQDIGVNTLRVLDDDEATDNMSGCAVFNGGIGIKKCVNCQEVNACLINARNMKISESLSVRQTLHVDGPLIPFTSHSVGTIGLVNKKWNEMHVICGYVQQMNSVRATINNATIDNIYLKTNVTTIEDVSAGSVTYNVLNQTSINLINMTSTHDADRIVTICIPNPITGSNNDVKRIIFKQNLTNKIKWSFNESDYKISDELEQIYDLVNVCGTWIFIQYGTSLKVINDTVSDISSIQLQNSYQDISLNLLQEQLTTLIDFNNFLSVADPSANTILDFINENNEIKDDLLGLQTSVQTIVDTVGCINALLTSTRSELTSFKTLVNSHIGDISGSSNINAETMNVFKSVVNTTFQNINTQLVCYDSKIANIALKTTEMTRDINRTKELTDIVDRRVSDHIASTDAKFKYINDKMNHINEKLNLIMQKIGLGFEC